MSAATKNEAPRVAGGIMGAMERTAVRVVDNVLLTATARVAASVGLPILLGMAGWVANSLVHLQQQNAVQAVEQARLVAEVRDLQEYRREAFGRGQRLTQENTSLLASVADLKRSLERIDQRIDKAMNGK